MSSLFSTSVISEVSQSNQLRGTEMMWEVAQGKLLSVQVKKIDFRRFLRNLFCEKGGDTVIGQIIVGTSAEKSNFLEFPGKAEWLAQSDIVTWGNNDQAQSGTGESIQLFR